MKLTTLYFPTGKLYIVPAVTGGKHTFNDSCSLDCDKAYEARVADHEAKIGWLDLQIKAMLTN